MVSWSKKKKILNIQCFGDLPPLSSLPSPKRLKFIYLYCLAPVNHCIKAKHKNYS